jgi:hypothetical protein
MIKSLNRDDVQVTPFVANKIWNPTNIEAADLILWMSGSLSGSISHIYIDYGDGTSLPVTNSYCDLALQQQSDDFVQYQRGLNITGTFFPVGNQYYNSSSNPTNIDNTYMRLVYNTNKQLFYNTYNNPIQLWGVENFKLDTTYRILTDVMDVFTIPRIYFGEKISPYSVKIIDDQYDSSYIIVDDGNENLILSGSYFSTYQEIEFTDI